MPDRATDGRSSAARNAKGGGSVRVIAGAARGRPLLAPGGRGTRPTSDRLKQALFNILGNAVPEADTLDLYAGSGALGIEALSRGARSVTFVERDPRAARTLRTNLARCGYRPGGAVRVIVADVESACRRLLRDGAAVTSRPAGPVTVSPHAAASGPLPPGSAMTAAPSAATRPTRSEPAPSGTAQLPASLPAAAASPAAASPAAGPLAAASPRAPAPAAPAPGPPFALVLADPPYATGEAARLLDLLGRAGAPLLAPGGALVAIEHGRGEEMPDAAGNLRLTRQRAQGRGCISVYSLDADPA